MLQTRYSANVMPKLCWSPKLQKAQLASIFYVDKEEQENGVLTADSLRRTRFHFNQKLKKRYSTPIHLLVSDSDGTAPPPFHGVLKLF